LVRLAVIDGHPPIASGVVILSILGCLGGQGIYGTARPID
jgi:hypothetical protein